MAIKRSELIDDENPGFYHLISRCVRRTFLCGFDKETGQSFEHRRQWIESRILELAKIFSIDVYSYAVMQNHYHLVVYFNPKAPWQWSDSTVAERWLKLFPIRRSNPNYQSAYQAKIESILDNENQLELCRKKLGSISWLMRCINEPIAKQSNKEDFVKGHFWESRFKSQALLDETAAITCMAYVDLNPVRAAVSNTIEESEYCSIQKRLIGMTQAQLEQAVSAVKGEVESSKLSINLGDYIELVEWTGKYINHPDKVSIPATLAPIFCRLNLNQSQWINQVNTFGNNYGRAVGALKLMRMKAKVLGLRWIKGVIATKSLYTTSKIIT